MPHLVRLDRHLPDKQEDLPRLDRGLPGKQADCPIVVASCKDWQGSRGL